MQYAQARYGRIFVIRLENGDVIHEQIEALAAKEHVERGMIFILGGADKGSQIASGPENGDDIHRDMPVISQIFDAVHESVGLGTLFPCGQGRPMLHLHMAFGRGDRAAIGCTRNGVVTWRYMEAVLIELTDNQSCRVEDPQTGFYMLKP
jgi:predicted DNA-binding protein with PD1-like motif